MMIRPPVSLYIHFPWCVRKCPYCDFNSHALRADLPEQEYVDALLLDLDQDLEWIDREPLASIFLGGGTPSLFSPDSLKRLFDGVRTRIALAKEVEITLEANPGTVESWKFKEYRALGINRLSLGIQSFQDTKLTTLGRIHSAKEAIGAVETAHNAGFTNLNLDLMFGLPGQNLEAALEDITTAISLEPTHISYYQLTLEPHTLFAKYPPPLPQEESIWSIQNACQERLHDAGYHQYEISAYARSGYQCHHNLNYWRFGDYLGIGAGAHGKITTSSSNQIHRVWKVRHPSHYLDRAGGINRLGGREEVPEKERPLEFFMNTLRLREGFMAEQFERHTGIPFVQTEIVLEQLLDDGLLTRHDGRIRCSERGWSFLDTILQRFTY